MKEDIIKPELLAPAGNFEKLEIAIHYGADAVYLAGKDFSLRNFSDNFSDEELFAAVKLARQKNVKVYLACNIYSRSSEQSDLMEFLTRMADIKPDAVIISDPGIILLAKQIIPDIDIHLSTQANTTNQSAARFWHNLGIKRVNLARELSLPEIEQISRNCPIETEIFIHGAMCVSYSGRCLLSAYLSGRDSNRGLCSHPCRWKYSVVEELRPNEYHPVMEDSRGSYIFNSKDLCMIKHIPALVNAGITSLKIEGRMKGINYLASVIKTYREAIDAYIDAPDSFEFNPAWQDELDRIFHREYCTGFYLNSPEEHAPNYKNLHTGEIHSFVGKILSSPAPGYYLVQIRNKLVRHDTIEILSPKGRNCQTKVTELLDTDRKPIDQTHPNTCAILKINSPCQPDDIVRKI
ncbi:MAG: U32 family peptidase [Proteobacteria bacterium]|nr:U32 family peptidase [Pseudomonadota bacterium]MBU1387907.1 U32 family peptidase [Pseudomonadota bacterium]MBU1541970.1 U32 family peptidase [Pseudomonadota bacterium]MBU2481334.1 U32 family peptidase [Pseudomonadota bacterium]